MEARAAPLFRYIDLGTSDAGLDVERAHLSGPARIHFSAFTMRSTLVRTMSM